VNGDRMTQAQFASPSIEIPARSIPGVSGSAVVGWLVVFTLLEFACAKLEPIRASGSLAGIPYVLTALECFELFLLARMFDWKATQTRVGMIEAMATIVLIAAVCLFANGRPWFTAGVLSLYFLCRFGRNLEHRRLAIGMFAFIAQYLLLAGPFIWLHSFVGSLDAGVLRVILPALGYDVTGYGTFIIGPSQNYAIDVGGGCASSRVAATAIPGFVIVILGLRGWFRRADLGYAAALLAAIVLVNWLRLIPIALSREGWLYWHEGEGKSIVSAIDALMIVGMAFLAIAQKRRSGASP
jgi:hypothetical protein